MDGIELVGIIVGAQIPTWMALWKMNRVIGRLEGRIEAVSNLKKR